MTPPAQANYWRWLWCLYCHPYCPARTSTTKSTTTSCERTPRPKWHNQLPLPAVLNIKCYKCASEYLPMAWQMKLQPNLPIPQSYPLLQIDRQIIVCNLQSSLWDTASTPNYHKYLQKKLKWKAWDCKNINWLALKLAIQQFKHNDQQQLQKFLHDWLPLWAALHMTQPTSSHTCPMCHQASEDFWHFLECQHPSQHAAYQQMQVSLQQLHHTHQVDPHMMQVLWQGLDLVHNQHPINNQREGYPPNFQQMYDDQWNIGWEKLFYGQISTFWAYFVDHSTQYKTNGTIFYSQITVCIWKYILLSWTIRNAALHPKHLHQQTIQLLTPQVQHLFSIIADDPALQEYKPQATIEQVLQWPICTIWTFIQTGYQHVHSHTMAARIRAIHKTHDICTYFQTLLQRNDNHPP